MTSKILGTVEGIGSTISGKAMSWLDSFFPPEKRAELFERAKAYVLKNPKISAFLLTNIVLTGPPLVIFTIFLLSVFIFAFIVALLVALIAAVAFTLVAVGFALLILFPTIFFTTLLAVFLFLGGLGGWYLLKYLNGGKIGAKGETLGDSLNSLTGNHLDFVMDNAREGHVERLLGDKQSEWKAPSPHHAPKQPQTNGTPKKQQQHKKSDSNGSDTATASGSDAKTKKASPTASKSKGANGVKSGTDGVSKVANPEHVTKTAGGVTKTAGLDEHTEKVKGAPKKLAQAPGTVKGTATGALGGATGLT